MKRFILLSVISIFILTNAAGQWYYNKYGVNSLNDLTKSELEGHLKRMKSWQGVSIFYSVASAAMLVGGIALYDASVDALNVPEGEEDYLAWAYYLGAFFGFSMLLGGAILTPLLITQIIVRSQRISQLKEALGSPDLKVGLLTFPKSLYPNAPGSPPAMGVTLTFHF